MDLDPIDEPWASGDERQAPLAKSPSLSPLYVSIGGDKDMGPFGGLDSVLDFGLDPYYMDRSLLVPGMYSPPPFFYSFYVMPLVRTKVKSKIVTENCLPRPVPRSPYLPPNRLQACKPASQQCLCVQLRPRPAALAASHLAVATAFALPSTQIFLHPSIHSFIHSVYVHQVHHQDSSRQ